MYVDLTTFKKYLGIETAADDWLLIACLTNAQAMIDARTQRTFEASTEVVLRFDAITDISDRTLLLRDDLCAVTEVVNGDGSVIPSTDYVLEPPRQSPSWGIRLKRSAAAWTYTDDPEDAISVEGLWAYSATAPADIAQAALRLAAWLYRQKDNAGDLDRAIVAGNSTLLPATLPSDIAAILNPYERVT